MPQDAPRIKYPRAWLALGVLVVLFLLAAIVVLIFFPPRLVLDQRGSAPVGVTQTATPNDYALLRHAFGPWRIVSNDASHASAGILLLKEDGTLEQGAVALSPDASWQPTVAIEFRDVELSGSTVLVRTTAGVVYELPVGHAFLLEARPSTVFAFDGQGYVIATQISTHGNGGEL